jgi:hypothetical protein
MQNPVKLLIRALGLWLSGRVLLYGSLQSDRLEDRGERFYAFRKVVVTPAPNQPARPGATFRVRFRFKNLSPGANRFLSLIPIPLILAQPGFRSKTWLLGEDSGDFIGDYEFDTTEEAEAYWDSLPLRMMRGRAEAGSLTHEVFPAD